MAINIRVEKKALILILKIDTAILFICMDESERDGKIRPFLEFRVSPAVYCIQRIKDRYYATIGVGFP